MYLYFDFLKLISPDNRTMGADFTIGYKGTPKNPISLFFPDREEEDLAR